MRVIIALALVMVGCYTKDEQTTIADCPEHPQIEFEIRSNCTDSESLDLITAIEEWERAIPGLRIDIVFTNTDPNVVYYPADFATANPITNEKGDLVGGHTYPDRIEIYLANIDDNVDIVFAHELGHFIFSSTGHVDTGIMVSRLSDIHLCISEQDLDHVCPDCVSSSTC